MTDAPTIPETVREGGDAMLAAYLYLVNAEDPTLTEMCEAMGTPMVRLIPVLDMMEEAGVIARDPDERDRIHTNTGTQTA